MYYQGTDRAWACNSGTWARTSLSSLLLYLANGHIFPDRVSDGEMVWYLSMGPTQRMGRSATHRGSVVNRLAGKGGESLCIPHIHRIVW